MAKARHNRGKRIEVTKDDFDYMLGVLPPIRARGCYGISEAYSDDEDGTPLRIWFSRAHEIHYCLFGSRTEAEKVFG